MTSRQRRQTSWYVRVQGLATQYVPDVFCATRTASMIGTSNSGGRVLMRGVSCWGLWFRAGSSPIETACSP